MEITLPVVGIVAFILVVAVFGPLGLGFLIQVVFRPRVVPTGVYWLLAVLWIGLLWVALGCRLSVGASGWAVQILGGVLSIGTRGMIGAGPFEWAVAIFGVVILIVCPAVLFRTGGAFAQGLLMKPNTNVTS